MLRQKELNGEFQLKQTLSVLRWALCCTFGTASATITTPAQSRATPHPSTRRSPATARRALTRCLFGVIAHETLPRPRFLAVAEQIEEPHFFQVHLHVVQVLGQQGEKPKVLRWRMAAVSTSEPPSQQALTCPCTSLITSST